MKKFYMVIQAEDGGTSKFRHNSFYEAAGEAERLCKKEGKPFIILGAMSYCQQQSAPIDWVKIKED